MNDSPVKQGKSRIRIIIVVVIVIVALLAIINYSLQVLRAKAQEGIVTASGTIEATEVDVSAEVSGRIVKLLVDEGNTVTKGQVIAILDGETVEGQKAQAVGGVATAQSRLADIAQGSREEQIRAARAQLDQAREAAAGAARSLSLAEESYSKRDELKTQLVSAQTASDSAQDAYKQAQSRLDLAVAGPRKEQIDQAKAAVDQAKAQADNARANASRAEQLYDKGAISAQQRDAAVTLRDAANGALDAAASRLAELQAGSRPEDLAQAKAAAAQAKAQMDGAKRTLDTVQQLYDDRLALKQQVTQAQTARDTTNQQVKAAQAQLDLLIAGPTTQAVDAAKGQVVQAQGALQSAAALEGYLTVKAPVSGTVILKNMEQGELATAGAPIVRIADLDSVWVRVYVPLTQLTIKVGDIATVTTDTYTMKFGGRVTEVSENPEFTPKNVQTHEQRVKLVYGVKVEMSNPKHDLKPGMPADATIRVGKGSRG